MELITSRNALYPEEFQLDDIQKLDVLGDITDFSAEFGDGFITENSQTPKRTQTLENQIHNVNSNQGFDFQQMRQSSQSPEKASPQPNRNRNKRRKLEFNKELNPLVSPSQANGDIGYYYQYVPQKTIVLDSPSNISELQRIKGPVFILPGTICICPGGEEVSILPVQLRQTLPVGKDGTIRIHGKVYNSRGYEICGAMNKFKKPCQRLGSKCPFHTNSVDISVSTPKVGAEKNYVAPSEPFKKGWTMSEHLLFLKGLQQQGRNWKEISKVLPTRTPSQIQAHANRYFQRQQKGIKNKRSIHDFTVDDIDELEQQISDTGVQNEIPEKQNQLNMYNLNNEAGAVWNQSTSIDQFTQSLASNTQSTFVNFGQLDEIQNTVDFSS